jgi:hypothetical protein
MRIVPASQGFNWLRIGWLLFMRNPFVWILATFVVWLLSAVIAPMSYVGLIVAALAMPAFAVGFMSMGAAAEAGRPLEPTLLFTGFKQRLQPLITLGGVNLVGMCILGLLVYIGLTPASEAAVSSAPQGALTLPLTALPLPLSFWALLSMAFWFSPVLVAWHAMPPGKALFFSFFACLRNWRAFLIYGLMLVLFVMGALLLSILIFGIFFKSVLPEGMPLVQFAFAFVLGLMPMLLASLYASYRDIFGTPPAGHA